MTKKEEKTPIIGYFLFASLILAFGSFVWIVFLDVHLMTKYIEGPTYYGELTNPYDIGLKEGAMFLPITLGKIGFAGFVVSFGIMIVESWIARLVKKYETKPKKRDSK